MSNGHVFTIFIFVLSKECLHPSTLHIHTNVSLMSLTFLVMFLTSGSTYCPFNYFKCCCSLLL
jgi:hypothetical protein